MRRWRLLLTLTNVSSTALTVALNFFAEHSSGFAGWRRKLIWTVGRLAKSSRGVREVATAEVDVLETKKPMWRVFTSRSSVTKMCGIVYALVILVAVCSLIANVATRYSSATHLQSDAQTSIHKDSSSGSYHQRLTKDATKWVPILLRWGLLQTPTQSCRVTFDPPDLPAFIADENLYNRPPPVA